MRSRSSTSSWRTRAGYGTRRSPSRPSRPSPTPPREMAVTATLSEADLLRVWEEGSAQPPAGRTLALLAAANPGFSLSQLAQLTVGERDELLLGLRERCLGPALPGWADCPGCAQALQVTIEADQVRAAWGAEVPTEGSVHA